MILSAQISFFSSYYPNLYFVRPLSFFCFISFISLYKSNPYFADAPMISLLKLFYCFTDTNLILLLTIIFFLLPFLLFLCIIQIHTFFKPHDFSAQILFFLHTIQTHTLSHPHHFFLPHFIISLYIPNPYFVETPMISLSQIFFPSLIIPNPYFVLPPSFFCLSSFFS